MARWHTRCRKCQTRRVLARHPDEYIRQPACRVCGQRNYRVDQWMMKRNTFSQRCNCGGYWFPHRMGSTHCWHRPDGSARLPGDNDFKERS